MKVATEVYRGHNFRVRLSQAVGGELDGEVILVFTRLYEPTDTECALVRIRGNRTTETHFRLSRGAAIGLFTLLVRSMFRTKAEDEKMASSRFMRVMRSRNGGKA